MALNPFIYLLVLVLSVPANDDVFLSFRSQDTGRNFTGHLYTALIRAGIHTFKFDKGIRRGENMTLAIDRAINKSKMSIIVFSKNYASSIRCLDELVTIMERRRTAGLFVIPIFYKVDPAEVEEQTNIYGEAFSEHEERFEEDMDRVKRWRGALKEVTSLAGMVLHDRPVKREAQFIQRVVEEVQNRLNSVLLNVQPNQNVPPYLKGSSFIIGICCFLFGVFITGTANYLCSRSRNAGRRARPILPD